jgi:hypothetical protein
MANTQVSRAEIVAILRSRGKSARADWFERELPAIVDLGKNRSLLGTLEIDPAELSPVGSDPRRDSVRDHALMS